MVYYHLGYRSGWLMLSFMEWVVSQAFIYQPWTRPKIEGEFDGGIPKYVETKMQGNKLFAISEASKILET